MKVTGYFLVIVLLGVLISVPTLQKDTFAQLTSPISTHAPGKINPFWDTYAACATDSSLYSGTWHQYYVGFSEHWDKIVFKIVNDPSGKIPKGLLNTILDIKVPDDTSKLSDVKAKVKAFFIKGPRQVEPYSSVTVPALTENEANNLDIRIIDVEYDFVCQANQYYGYFYWYWWWYYPWYCYSYGFCPDGGNQLPPLPDLPTPPGLESQTGQIPKIPSNITPHMPGSGSGMPGLPGSGGQGFPGGLPSLK